MSWLFASGDQNPFFKQFDAFMYLGELTVSLFTCLSSQKIVILAQPIPIKL